MRVINGECERETVCVCLCVIGLGVDRLSTSSRCTATGMDKGAHNLRTTGMDAHIRN